MTIKARGNATVSCPTGKTATFSMALQIYNAGGWGTKSQRTLTSVGTGRYYSPSSGYNTIDPNDCDPNGSGFGKRTKITVSGSNAYADNFCP